ncbi:polysaccharide deacetylase family protein [Mucilaginibacter sp. UR6-11]|uniref:polysaccharide deacetylase family protein n=1 Tax=Mucilaginibacter sp. UR6-11 TaxID=1435644 RepID=UPI001E49A5DD|nr:polysaccharide deacetylase family protein [Mucilaginibacter sp. UR6-11]MCC8425339.1 polysaccharide deacetylase family protein [Mucilaginibacter sp. UR6-11]
MYLVRTPWLLKKLYPRLTWDTNKADRCIFLTFDDGPIPIVTPFVLNILKQYNAKATFFCIGDNIRKHPDIFEKVKAGGHAVGNHTYNHLKGWDTDDTAYLDNFLLADRFINTNLFRPPYGRIKRSQAKLLKKAKPNLKLIMWNVLSGDFDTSLKPGRCLDNLINNTRPGDIVLFHDSLKAFERLEYALPKALEYWSKQGYEFKSLDVGWFE